MGRGYQNIKSINFKSRVKAYRANSTARKAGQLLAVRVAGTPSAPLRTGGWYGGYSQRGRNELKTCDTGTPAVVSIPSAGAIILLNGIGQGTDYTQRIGRKVQLKSILFRFDILQKTQSAPDGDTARVMLIYDCQTNAAAPVVGDILQTVNYLSPMNLNNRDRFKVLYDKFIPLNPMQTVTNPYGTPLRKNFKVFKKLKEEMIFGNTSNTVADITTGAIFLLVISQMGGGSSATNMYYNSRIRFSDP